MTPHIEANVGDIAPTVIMPGDPLRAKMIAEKYLENPRLVSSVRNIFAYTGTYKGKEITIMASGMGIPSMGIYSYELYNVYNVENIIRVGTAGSYTTDLKLFDVVLADACYSESTYAKTHNGDLDNIMFADKTLNEKIKETAIENNININECIIHSSDVFYKDNNRFEELRKLYGCMCVEMESFALFHNAKAFNKHAACILTISDSLVTKEETTSEERQNAFNTMIELALLSTLKI